MSEWTKDKWQISYGDTLGFMDIEMLRKAFALRDAEIDRLRNELAELNARLIRAEERLAVTTANADKLRAEIAEIKEELAQAREATRVKHLEAVWLQAKLDNAEVQR